MDKETIKEILNNYINELKNNNIHFEKAYLFGSYTKNTADENSDIDIAFIFKSIDNKFDLQVKLMKLRRRIDLRIEPHPFEEINFNQFNPFAQEIIKYGIELS